LADEFNFATLTIPGGGEVPAQDLGLFGAGLARIGPFSAGSSR
jgi:hypothetical protein